MVPYPISLSCNEFSKLHFNVSFVLMLHGFQAEGSLGIIPGIYIYITTNIIIQIMLIRYCTATNPHDHKPGCNGECEQPGVSSAGKY